MLNTLEQKFFNNKYFEALRMNNSIIYINKKQNAHLNMTVRFTNSGNPFFCRICWEALMCNWTCLCQPITYLNQIEDIFLSNEALM